MLRDNKIKTIIDCWKVPVLILLALLLRFMPYGIHATEIMQKFRIPIQLLAVFCSIVIARRYFRINKLYFLLVLYFAIKLFSTVLNRQDVFTCAWDAISCMSMVVIIEWGIKKDYRTCVDIVCVYFVLMLLFNVFSVVFNSNSDLVYKGCFLGHKNTFIIYGLSALLFAGIRRYDETVYKPVFWIATWIILIITYILKPSSTSTFGLMCLLIYVLVFNRTWTRKILNIKLYLIGVVLIFILVVYKQYSGQIIEFLTGIMGENPTFTGRTYIWKDYIDTTGKSILLGFGYASESGLATIFSGTAAGDMPNAHNIILNVVFQTGMIGLIAVIALLVVVVNCLTAIQNDRIRYFFEALLGVLLLMSQFEAYSQELYFLVFGVIYFYADMNKGGKRK